MTSLPQIPDATTLYLDGPWDCAFGFAVPGRVQSKSNHRAGNSDAWSELSGYASVVNFHALAARPDGWAVPAPTKEPGEPVIVAALVARTMLDAGNISKSILDACEGVLYRNDAQVACVCDHAVRTRDRQGLWAAFAQLRPGVSHTEVATAAATLLLNVTRTVTQAP